MPVTYRTTRRVEFADTDMAGIVHFARFFCYMESAEHELLRSLGLSVTMDWEGEPISFPRVGASCDYLRPARFEEVLVVEVTVQRIGEKSVTYGFEFSSDGEAVARGRITAVCCRVGPGPGIESRPIPDGIRTRLGQGAA